MRAHHYSASVESHLTEFVAALQVDRQKSSLRTGSAKIDVRVTSSDGDVRSLSGRPSVGTVRSGMPATCSPTITLLQKRRGIAVYNRIIKHNSQMLLNRSLIEEFNGVILSVAYLVEYVIRSVKSVQTLARSSTWTRSHSATQATRSYTKALIISLIWLQFHC